MEAAATVNAHVAMTSRVEERRDSSLWKSSNAAGEDPRPVAPSLSLHIRSNAVGRKARGVVGKHPLDPPIVCRGEGKRGTAWCQEVVLPKRESFIFRMFVLRWVLGGGQKLAPISHGEHVENLNFL